MLQPKLSLKVRIGPLAVPCDRSSDGHGCDHDFVDDTGQHRQIKYADHGDQQR